MKLAATVVIVLATIQPAAALEFGFVPTGPVTLDTGNITATTSEATYPGAAVNIADLSDGISFGSLVTLSGPFELINGPINLTVSVAGYSFLLDEATRGVFTPTGPGVGSFSMGYSGPDGVTASQSCDQVKLGGAANCSDVLVQQPTVTPEPSSLALLGGALIGAGLLGRRRRTNA